MKKIYVYISLIAIAIGQSSCLKDLNQVPYVQESSEVIYRDPSKYEGVLAKLYAGLGTTGQQGPAGKPDIVVPDEGFSEYTRQYWKLQELSTDEAVVGWGDNGVQDFHSMNWSTSNQFITNFYNRLFFQISTCNDFLRETTNERLKERGVEQAVAGFIKNYRAEARFLRALSYYHALDMYGNVPFVTESDAVGAFSPKQIQRKDLAVFIESELKTIEPDLLPAKSGLFRANQATCWALLARFYLNYATYTGQSKYNEAAEYSNKVINAGYSLQTSYPTLFMTDNNTSNEIVFSVAYDGLQTQTWGGTTFLVNAAIGGKMTPADYGTTEHWEGIRTTKALVNRFSDDDIKGNGDKRAIFYTSGQKLEIDDIVPFTDGYAVPKFVNKSSDGKPGSHPKHSDTDFPVFRLAEFYLIYAEAALRGATNTDQTTALNYINKLRTRANAKSITTSDLTLDFLLDERSRELFWEGHRRTDLIRFGKFTTGSFLWPWKGGVKNGVEVSSHLELYPIPADDMTANGNLKQNSGY